MRPHAARVRRIIGRIAILLGPPFAAALASRAAPPTSHCRSRARQSASFGRGRRSVRPMSSHDAAGDAGGPPPARWSDLRSNGDDEGRRWRSLADGLFPPLAPSSHKGSHGRVAIFGGSEKYTGAPYYAAASALRCGVDLATVFCANEASVPIKCYSPELMVQGVYSVEELDSLVEEEAGLLRELELCRQSNGVMTNEANGAELLRTMEKLEHSEEKQNLLARSELEKDDRAEALAERLQKMKGLEERLQSLRERKDVSITSIVDAIASTFPTLHALCIGPGLGRHPLVFVAAERVIREALESNLTLILDADALFMLSLEEHRSLLGELRGYDRCVMTPNLMERRRLDVATSEEGRRSEGYSNTVVQKGDTDTITHGSSTMQCEEEGGLKRSGGIGDVLAGTLTAFAAWNAILERDAATNGSDDRRQHQRLFASWAACCAVKRGTRRAFERRRRAMSATDVIEEIGEVVGGMEEELEWNKHKVLPQKSNVLNKSP